MPIIFSETALTVALNAKSTDRVTGTFQYIQPGILNIAARGSATGLNISLLANGQVIIDDKPLPFTGTAGAISRVDHSLGNFIAAGRIECYFRNTTGGALTVDAILEYQPLPGK